MNNPFVSVVIANYNGEKYLNTCLTSLLKTSYKSFEVLLVDDGSTDKSEEIIRQFMKKDKRIILKINNSNLGAAARRNEAIKVVQGDIVVFLDNDTDVDKFWLTEIVKTLTKNEDIGACQSKIVDFKKRDILQMAGAKLWAATGWGLPIGQWEKKERYINEEEIFAISAALAVKKSVLNRVGGFDEQEAIVTEDLDLSWRIWIAGYKIVLCPASIVFHWTKNVSMRKNMKHNTQVIYFHLTKNSFISILKNYEAGNAAKYFFSSLIINLCRGILVVYSRHDFGAFLSTLKAFGYTLINLPGILEKRKDVQKTRKTTDKELFKSVIVKKGIIQVYREYFTQTKLL